MHVDFRTGSFVYDNWYDVTFRLEGMPGAVSLPPVKETPVGDTTVVKLTEGIMRPEAPQKQIKAQVVRTTPVKVTQATKSENLVTQAPIVAAGVVASKAPAVVTKADDKPAIQAATIPQTVKNQLLLRNHSQHQLKLNHKTRQRRLLSRLWVALCLD